MRRRGDVFFSIKYVRNVVYVRDSKTIFSKKQLKFFRNALISRMFNAKVVIKNRCTFTEHEFKTLYGLIAVAFFLR